MRLLALSLLLAWPIAARAQEAPDPGALSVRIAEPDRLYAGDRAELTAWVSGAGSHVVLLTPTSEGTAVEVVRGRILRAEARDPAADPLEFRIPLVAHRAGTAVVRVVVAGYACERFCRRVEREASIVLRVAPERDAREKKQSRAEPSQDATPRTSSLSWVRLPGAEDCIGSAELARAVEQQLDRSVFVSAADAAIAVEGRAEPNPQGGVRAVIAVADREGTPIGERTLDADRCESLREMVVVAIALMIDPLTAPVDPPPSDDEPETRVVVRTERVEVPVDRGWPGDAPEVAPRPRWRVEIDAAVVGELGLLPTPMVGGLTTVIVEPPGFVPIALEGALLPFSRADLEGGDHVDFLQVHAGLMICPLWWRETALSVHACLGADAGAMIVIGETQAVDEGERVIGQGHLTVRGHWDVIGPLTMRLAVHFLVPFRHDAFTIAGVPFYTPEWVAGMIDLGVGVHFD